MAVMMSPRERWTDERLDDLNEKIAEGFARSEADIRELRGDLKREAAGLRTEIGGLRSEIGGLRNELGGLRSELSARLDSMNRNFVAGLVAVIATVLGSNVF